MPIMKKAKSIQSMFVALRRGGLEIGGVKLPRFKLLQCMDMKGLWSFHGKHYCVYCKLDRKFSHLLVDQESTVVNPQLFLDREDGLDLNDLAQYDEEEDCWKLNPGELRLKHEAIPDSLLVGTNRQDLLLDLVLHGVTR